MPGNNTISDGYWCITVAADGPVLQQGYPMDRGVLTDIDIIDGPGIDDFRTGSDVSGVAFLLAGIVFNHLIDCRNQLRIMAIAGQYISQLGGQPVEHQQFPATTFV